MEAAGASSESVAIEMACLDEHGAAEKIVLQAALERENEDFKKLKEEEIRKNNLRKYL